MVARSSRRRGAAAIELLFVFPLLLAVLLATVEFSQWLSGQQQVALASREGARVAATGGTLDDVHLAVEQVLGAGRFAQAVVVAELTDSNGDPIPSGDAVAVTVQVPASSYVPDVLAFVGLSIRGVNLISQTVMRKE